ncbi:MAG: hypothetical protein JXL80_18310 [Planctomycetes bacterium]|nr:hypothetical protein [Planctomycetota bacterium]
MARDYSPKAFLRHAPNALLKEYFSGERALAGIDFDTLGESEIDGVFAAIEALSPGDQREIEADFRAVNELSTAAGVRAIVEEAAFWKKDWAASFEAMANHYERALWTFLNDHRVFAVATDLAYMDSMTPGRRRFVGLHLDPAVDTSDLANLEEELCKFYARQGRGHHCHVDNYLRHDPERHCYFAYPEDYATTDESFDDAGHFERKSRKPAFEIIFIYRPEDGLLEVNARGKKEEITALQELFCRTILGLKGLPDDRRPAFDLSGLKRRDFDFVTDPHDDIQSVVVKLLRLDLAGGFNRRIILEANASQRAPDAVYDLLDEALNKQQLRVDDALLYRVKLQFVFGSRDGKRPKTLTFEIAHPDRCTLKDDPYDQVAKKYLKRWKIASE